VFPKEVGEPIRQYVLDVHRRPRVEFLGGFQKLSEDALTGVVDSAVGNVQTLERQELAQVQQPAAAVTDVHFHPLVIEPDVVRPAAFIEVVNERR
jgi:hypothetical protein